MKRLAVGVLLGALLLGGIAAAQSTSFNDVDEGRFFTESVAWAADNGITTGYPDGRFGPYDAVTRGQMVTFLKRYHDNLGPGTLESIVGPAGPAGPQGETGPQGPQGEPGPIGGLDGDPVGAVRFGVSTQGCVSGEYRLVVAQAEGTPPPFTSQDCTATSFWDCCLGNEIPMPARAEWQSDILVVAADSGAMSGLYWDLREDPFVAVNGEVYQLSCSDSSQNSSLGEADGVGVDLEGMGGIYHWTPGDVLRVACDITLRSYSRNESYPTVGGQVIQAGLTEALNSEDLMSGTLYFFSTQDLPDSPPVSTTTSIAADAL